jgi:pimeloyl-ACP methyl ester carboxylesterase
MARLRRAPTTPPTKPDASRRPCLLRAKANRAAPRLPRRALLQAGGAATRASCSAPSGPGQEFLEPERVKNWDLPALQVAAVGGGKISYAIQGSGPLLLYFHGWGDDFRVVLPLEHPLIEAGFRLLVVHRPGYAGTTLEGEVDGRKVDWRSAASFACAVGALLDKLYGSGNWSLAVIGTSGGAPSALAFAEQHARQTRALLLQAGVTTPWSEAKFVPALFRDSYLTAFRRFGWAGEHLSRIVFGLLVKLRENFLDDEDRLKALTGSRFEEAKSDPAFGVVVSLILREDPANRWGELNDVFHIFFAKSAFCRWERVTTRTLIVHDPADPFVPFVHAETAAQQVAPARLSPFHLAGHILWLGPEARAMHEARVNFLQAG